MFYEKKIEDTQGVITSHKSEDRKDMPNEKASNCRQIATQKIQQHEPNIIRGYNQGFRKGYGTFAILFVQKPVISHEKGKENGVVAKQNEHIRNYL